MIRRYGLLIGLLMVSASAFTWPSPLGGAPVAESPTGCQQAGQALIWLFKPFKPMGSWKDSLEKKSQVNADLVVKYWSACLPLRFTFRFCHCTPTTYLASGLYYCALLTGSVKGYEKIKKLLNRKLSKKNDKKLKSANTYPDCVWCMARREKMNVHNHTVEESI